jgi:hypothetical protein
MQSEELKMMNYHLSWKIGRITQPKVYFSYSGFTAPTGRHPKAKGAALRESAASPFPYPMVYVIKDHQLHQNPAFGNAGERGLTTSPRPSPQGEGEV